jgi:4'-phosphopantetheinyl transferase
MTTASGLVEVYWTPRRRIRPHDLALLDDAERGRAGRYVRLADRERFVTAAVQLRRLLGSRLDRRPGSVPIDRTCPACGNPHGRPALPDHSFHLSVAHSGRWCGIALTRVGEVGLDIEERRDRPLVDLPTAVLGPGEGASSVDDFYRYWTRKEAVVKATGDGLRAELSEVLVGPAREAPRLISYPGRRPPPDAAIFDLAAVPGYFAALAVLTDRPVDLKVTWSPGLAGDEDPNCPPAYPSAGSLGSAGSGGEVEFPQVKELHPPRTSPYPAKLDSVTWSSP